MEEDDSLAAGADALLVLLELSDLLDNLSLLLEAFLNNGAGFGKIEVVEEWEEE